MKISIITWDGNFREYTHAIDFFTRQEFDQNEFEFIWVDFYNSNNHVRQKIECFPNIRLLTLGNLPHTLWHLGKCINAGVKYSSGEILVIPDGDIAVEPDFLGYVWQAHQNYQDLALYFRRYDEPQGANNNQSHTSITYLKQFAKLTNPTNYASCLSLKRKNFDTIRGHETHEAFAGPGMNGMEMYIRCHNAGMAVKWAPDKKVYHPWHPSSGSTGHDNSKALRLARNKYHWINPYAGLKQSWIVNCRELQLDVVANEMACEEYLTRMPQVDIDYYQKLCERNYNNFFVKVFQKASGLFRRAW